MVRLRFEPSAPNHDALTTRPQRPSCNHYPFLTEYKRFMIESGIYLFKKNN